MGIALTSACVGASITFAHQAALAFGDGFAIAFVGLGALGALHSICGECGVAEALRPAQIENTEDAKKGDRTKRCTRHRP